MKSTFLMVLGGALVAMTVAAGIVHGRWTNRWGHRPDILSASERLEKLPLVIGDWQAKDDRKIYEYNYTATKDSIRNAMTGKPTVDEMIKGKDTVVHPFKGF